MGSLSEVVTLQLGHYANFIGTHWWNIQESSFVYSPDEEKEINHDVLWREGQNINGEVTYTPRLVAFDLKGSLNTLRQEGTLYDIPEAAENIPWLSDVTLHKTASAPKNKFLQDLEAAENVEDTEMSEPDKEECVSKIIEPPPTEPGEPVYRSKLYNLDDSVKVWSDFLRVHLHPRTVHIVNQYDVDQYSNDDSDIRLFNVFGYGRSVYKDYNTQAEIEDRLHFFLEECDRLQGLQVLVDPYDGFGGLGSGILEDLADDYGNKAILSVPVTPMTFNKNMIRDQCHRAVNTVLTTDSLLSYSSTLLPLSLQNSVKFPYLSYKPGLLYHTSAILAASLDCATMPYRLDANPASMSCMLDSLCQSGRKVLGLQSSLPFPICPEQSFVGSLLEQGDEMVWRPVSAGCTLASRPWAQAVLLRGLDSSRLHSSHPLAVEVDRLQQCTTIPEVLNLYLEEVTATKLNHISTLNSPLNFQAPFPHVFTPKVSSNGELAVKDRDAGVGVNSGPIMTSLQATHDMKNYLRDMLDSVKKFNIKKFHKFLEAGLEEDDYQETLVRLEAAHDLYEQ